MVNNKKGLSAIVATLIVVLLAIVAFGIISGFIQDVVTGKTEEAELASSDTRLDVQKASVEGNMSSVSVRREGSDDLEVVGSRVVFDSGDGRAVASSNFSIGKQELDTFSIPLCSEEFSDVDFSSEDLSATVYPIIMHEGDEKMLDGNPSSVDFVEVDSPELVDNCNKSSSSGSDSDGGTGGSGDDDSEDDSGDNSGGGTGDGSGNGDSLPACTDSDGDGWIKEENSSVCNTSSISSNYKGSGDCNDRELKVNPGISTEGTLCNDGLDNDCDGKIDSNDSDCSGTCIDQDGDGYAKNGTYRVWCIINGISSGGDCNDNSANANPGINTETCFDNIDNDCDGQVDEGCGNSGATPGDGDTGGQGSFEVEPKEYPAFFDTKSRPSKIPLEFKFSNNAGVKINEINVEPSQNIEQHLSYANSFSLPKEGKEFVVEVNNPGNTVRRRGNINFTSEEYGKSNVPVIIGVRN